MMDLINGRDSGIATALLIMGGNLFGAAVPIITGDIVATSGGYSGALPIAGAIRNRAIEAV